jgi:hypothetical protein
MAEAKKIAWIGLAVGMTLALWLLAGGVSFIR